MMFHSNRSIGWLMGLGFTLLAGICTIAVGLYVFKARQHLGSNYTSLVADVVRPQLHTTLLRSTLSSLQERPQDPVLIKRLNNLLWRIPQHIEGVRFSLGRSPLIPADYEGAINQLSGVKAQLAEMQQQLNELAEGASLNALIQQGFTVENDLARAYGELNNLIHQKAAQQRIVMDWLAISIAILIVIILLLVGGLMQAMLRLNRQNRKVTELSFIDELTGLGNRRYLNSITENLYLQSQRHPRPVSLALLDFDHFKQVNDNFGHPAGDRVLQVFSKAVLAETREADVVARLGGEEFCVLMPNTDTKNAQAVAERIRQRISTLSPQELGIPVSVTISLGLATAHTGNTTFNRLYSRADQALYQAKTNGRNRVEID